MSLNSTSQLFLRSNLFYGFCKYRALHNVFFLILVKSNIFQVYWFVDFVILSVCLSVCLSPTGHKSKPLVMKLYQIVEVVSTEKPNDFEVKGQRSSWGQFSKFVIFHPTDLKLQDLHIASINWETNYFWDEEVKGQLKGKLLKSSIFNWKIVNLHQINLKVEHDLQSITEFGKQLFLRSKGQRSTQGQSSKINNFNVKNNQFSSDWLEL